MMISSASSQQRLTDSTVIVPIKSLKNALLVKVERDNLKKELVIARDSIKAMDTIIFRKDIIISVLDSTRVVLDSKVKDLNGVIVAKDGIINEKSKKITKLNNTIKKLTGAFMISVVGFIIALL